MTRIFRLVLLALLIALGIWSWLTLFPSPEKVIQRRLLKVAQLASFAPGEGNLSRVANVERLGGYFAEKTEVTVDAPHLENHTFNGRAELVQAAMAARQVASSLKVQFFDISVKINPDQETATALCTLEAKLSTDNEPIFQALKFSLKKTDGQWLINRIDSVKTLQ